MDILPIDEMPNLSARLGKAGMDRIRYARQGSHEREPRSTNIRNTVIQHMQNVEPNTLHCQVNELITAAANFDTNQSQALHISRIFTILQCIELINTREIIKMTNLDKRQAQKYLRAVKFILPFIHAHFNKLNQPPLHANNQHTPAGANTG